MISIDIANRYRYVFRLNHGDNWFRWVMPSGYIVETWVVSKYIITWYVVIDDKINIESVNDMVPIGAIIWGAMYSNSALHELQYKCLGMRPANERRRPSLIGRIPRLISAIHEFIEIHAITSNLDSWGGHISQVVVTITTRMVTSITSSVWQLHVSHVDLHSVVFHQ